MSEWREPVDFPLLTQRALADDARAWAELVDALSPIVWRLLLAHALGQAERDDAFAMTFLRLYERLETVTDPRALPGWIRTVARNEVYAISRARQRFSAVIELNTGSTVLAVDDDTVQVDEADGEADLRTAMAEALADLPDHEQRLLRMLSLDPRPSYGEIAATLGIPVGSIGPTYGRAKQRLARHRALIRYQASVAS
jgi:RNA polymerase sigma factor (sigma-70 family)